MLCEADDSTFLHTSATQACPWKVFLTEDKRPDGYGLRRLPLERSPEAQDVLESSTHITYNIS